MAKQLTDLTNQIIAYECGEMTYPEVITLFSELIKSGIVWNLQGAYGREAAYLIDSNFVSENGDILVDLDDFES